MTTTPLTTAFCARPAIETLINRTYSGFGLCPKSSMYSTVLAAAVFVHARPDVARGVRYVVHAALRRPAHDDAAAVFGGPKLEPDDCITVDLQIAQRRIAGARCRRAQWRAPRSVRRDRRVHGRPFGPRAAPALFGGPGHVARACTTSMKASHVFPRSIRKSRVFLAECTTFGKTRRTNHCRASRVVGGAAPVGKRTRLSIDTSGSMPAA